MTDQNVVNAIVVSKDSISNSQIPMRLALFKEDGTPYDFEGGEGSVPEPEPATGEDILLTGFVNEFEGSNAISSSDTVNVALAKLQSRIFNLEPAD